MMNYGYFPFWGIGAAYGYFPNMHPNHVYPARPDEGLVLLDRQVVDVTGDGHPDQVSLLGQKFSQDTVYYRRLFIQVADRATHKTTLIPLQGGGYHPAMRFCDFNGDRVADIYVSAETGGAGGTSDYYIYTVAHHVPRAIPVPRPLTITGQFLDDYRASISIQEQNKTYTLDLSEKKTSYDQAGYYKNGKLVNPTPVLPNDYGVLRPVDTDHNGVCELYGVQRIAGFYNADTIAYATSLWKWERDRWALIHAAVRKHV
ncbi:VCBS repeat-containing protein [Paenibacillus sp. P25]|nr:VCBS repeat-containing protein [Paenibacillus sp. P25]